MNKIKSIFLSLALAVSLCVNAETGLGLDTGSISQLTCSYTNGTYTIKTTGSDPFIYSNALTADLPFGEAKLMFQYKASADIDAFELFFGKPDATAGESKNYGTVLTATTEWKTASINIAAPKRNFSWGKKGNRLRFDFGTKSGITVQIRYLGINGTKTVSDSEKNNEVNAIAKYLSTVYPAKVDKVTVTESTVTIAGTTVANGCKLYDIRANGTAAPLLNASAVANLANGTFSVELPRFVSIDGYTYDRLLSKWAVTDASGNLQSHAHYADEVKAIRYAAPGIFKGKKGIGGIMETAATDIGPLGLHTVTFNVIANGLISINKTGDYTQAYTYCGRTYYINTSQQANNDKILKTCSDNDIIVAAIILFNTGGDPEYATAMLHPEYTSKGFYTMPNMTSMDGVHAYAATISYLADRYSKGDNGRIHHWIMHNEVDAHDTWTNMGADPKMLRFLDAYEKSLRLTSNIVRQYDPNAYVLGSFTSAWSMPGDGGFRPKQMLDEMVCYGNVEGDYRWGIAAHPYPQSFFKPKFWVDDTNATYNENSGYCTFKNIEVISDWVLRREHYYKGEEKRMLFFSENGVNSVDNSDANQTIQAAGAAWAWKKANHNTGVDAIMWHNWFDHPVEAKDNLRLGLRDSNLNPKKSWYVWQAAGTDNESAVLDQYLSTLGVSSWSQIHQGVALSGNEYYRFEFDTSSASGLTATHYGDYQSYKFVTTNGDPQIITGETTADISTNSNVLAFDYKADKDFELQVFFTPFATEAHSIIVPLKATSTWARTYVNIAAIRSDEKGWGANGSKLRFDIGNAAGVTVNMRHVVVNSGEIETNAVLGITSAGCNNCTVTESAPGAYKVVTSGTDPNFYTGKLATNLETSANKLLFEYKSSAAIDNLQFYFLDFAGELRSLKVSNIPAATEWTRMTVDISSIIIHHGWGFEGDYLRIDPGNAAGLTFQIRSLHVNDGTTTNGHILLLDHNSANNVLISQDVNMEPTEEETGFGPELAYKGWTVLTTASDPNMRTIPLELNLAPEATKLHIKYKSDVAITPLELFFLFPENQQRAKKYTDILPATIGDEALDVVIDIADMRSAWGWGYAGDVLRIDLGNDAGKNIQVQSIVINNSAESTDVEEIATDNFAIYGTTGGAVIISNEKRTFNVYNIVGMHIRRVEADGETFVPLAPGIYIISGKKVIVK